MKKLMFLFILFTSYHATVWPISGTEDADQMTSPFGPRNLASEPNFHYDFHRGIDIHAVCGTDVHAVKDGEVVHARWTGNFGNMVIIKHSDYLYTGYAHLNSIFVFEGESVSEGDIIGLSGNTGGNYSCHLHFNVLEHYEHPPRQHDIEFFALNPLRLLPHTVPWGSPFPYQHRHEEFFSDGDSVRWLLVIQHNDWLDYMLDLDDLLYEVYDIFGTSQDWGEAFFYNIAHRDYPQVDENPTDIDTDPQYDVRFRPYEFISYPNTTTYDSLWVTFYIDITPEVGWYIDLKALGVHPDSSDGCYTGDSTRIYIEGIGIEEDVSLFGWMERYNNTNHYRANLSWYSNKEGETQLWKLYRKVEGESEWTLIYSGTDEEYIDSYDFTDYDTAYYYVKEYKEGGEIYESEVLLLRAGFYGYSGFEEWKDPDPYENKPWNSLSQPICGVTGVIAEVKEYRNEHLTGWQFGAQLYKFKGYDESSDYGSCWKSFKVLSFGVINIV